MAVGRLRLKSRSYDFPPWRPPSESRSLLLRVTRGCTWNRCTFCSMYKQIPFQRRPREEILADIDAAADLCSADVETVFIGDSNSPSIPAADLAEVLKYLYARFPGITRVTSYARAKTLLKKPDHELAQLRQAGLTRLHVGIETGSPELLKKIQKGATPDEIAEGCLKAKLAGFELSVYILLGLGGEELSAAHARDTAALLNRIDPQYIRVRTLQPQPGSQIFEDLQAGRFRKASHETVLNEQLMLLERLRVTSQYLSDHITNYLPVNGRLPEARQDLLRSLRDALGELATSPELRARCARKDGLTNL